MPSSISLPRTASITWAVSEVLISNKTSGYDLLKSAANRGSTKALGMVLAAMTIFPETLFPTAVRSSSSFFKSSSIAKARG